MKDATSYTPTSSHLFPSLSTLSYPKQLIYTSISTFPLICPNPQLPPSLSFIISTHHTFPHSPDLPSPHLSSNLPPPLLLMALITPASLHLPTHLPSPLHHYGSSPPLFPFRSVTHTQCSLASPPSAHSRFLTFVFSHYTVCLSPLTFLPAYL